ncbi:MAG: beta-propeller domain-containing protein [Candidatus Aenigmarchaeota archaeon]|nr:beta-propeller domain-containing protein [Candidatus Aenigmarchaeota archaeon]
MVFSSFEKGFVLVALIVIGLSFVFVNYQWPATTGADQVKKFASCDELKSFIKSSETPYYGYGMMRTLGDVNVAWSAEQQAVGGEGAPKTEGGAGTSAEDYSMTNIQVEGVDEADIVKNDGKYIYTVSGNKVVIVDAYPAENAKILSEIDINGTPSQIFINGNKLVVFGSEGGYGGPYYKTYYYPYSQNSFIKVYDVSDRENPILKRDLFVNGSYYDSRMIGDYVYVIVNQPIYLGGEITVPMIASGGQAKSVCNCPDVYYFDVPDYSKRFTTIMAVNTNNDEEEPTGEVYVMGTTQNIYVSLNNIYMTYTKWLSEYDFIDRIVNEALLPLVPLDVKVRVNEIMKYNISSYSKMQEISSVVQNYINSLSDEERKDLETKMQEKMVVIQEEIAKEMEKTIIHKISINNGKVEYKAQGSVAGNALN